MWPSTEEEYNLAHFTTVLIVLGVVLVVDAAAHRLSIALAGPEHSRSGEHRRQLKQAVWQGLQAELAVLGSLPLLSWTANRIGLMGHVAEVAAEWPVAAPLPPAPPPLIEPQGVLHTIGSIRQQAQSALSCQPRMPTDAVSMFHLTADVTVALLVAVIVYYGFVYVVVHTSLQWLEGYRRLEAGSPPRNPAEHFALRQLDAMRAQLVGALRSDERVRKKLEHNVRAARPLETPHSPPRRRLSPAVGPFLSRDSQPLTCGGLGVGGAHGGGGPRFAVRLQLHLGGAAGARRDAHRLLAAVLAASGWLHARPGRDALLLCPVAPGAPPPTPSESAPTSPSPNPLGCDEPRLTRDPTPGRVLWRSSP